MTHYTNLLGYKNVAMAYRCFCGLSIYDYVRGITYRLPVMCIISHNQPSINDDVPTNRHDRHGDIDWDMLIG